MAARAMQLGALTFLEKPFESRRVKYSGPRVFMLSTSVLAKSRRQFQIAQQSEILDEIGSVGSKRESATHAATSVLPGLRHSLVAR